MQDAELFQSLCTVLQACLSPNQQQRSEAEVLLKQHETAQGQTVRLLRVAAEANVDLAVRQVAAISFKNLVKRSWEVKEGEGYQIPPEDRQPVRDNLLEILIHAPHAIQVQLGEVFKSIVYCDYPEQWPGLLPAIYQNLASQDKVRMHGALYALRLLARKYEFRDDEERAPLDDIVNMAFPVLLHIFQQLLAAPPTQPEVPELLKLVCKIFWSATYMGIPSVLLAQEQFVGWMTCIHSAVLLPVPQEVMPAKRDDWEAAPWWKAKKWLLHITHRLFSRYSVPKQCKEGNDRKFGDLFAAQCTQRFMEAHLQLLSLLASGQYLSPRVINLLLTYVTHAIGVKATYAATKAHWDSILHNVAFPLMCFSEQDAQLWREDPQEYIRKGYDILEDMYNPKTAAGNFAHELCLKKRSHLDQFMALLVGLLAQYQQAVALGAATEAQARRVDGAFLAIGCMVDILKEKAPYKQQLGVMLMTHVLPAFSSPFGFLRAKACWLAGVYADVEFADGKGQGASFGALFSRVVGCLADQDLPTRVDAVVALRHFVEEVEELDTLLPALPQLLNSIFGLMDQVDNEDLVFTLEAMVEKFGEQIAPFALQMAQQLANAFWRYAGQADDDDDDETAGIAAFGCLRALNTLLASVSTLTELFPVLEEALFPIMHKMISTDGQDVFEEVLEMLAYFTFYTAELSDRLWSLWPQLHQCLTEWAIDYWEHILVPLDNFVSRSTQRYLTCKAPDYQASVFQMCQHSLSGDFNDRDVVCAAKLLSVVLQVCRGQVDAWVAPYLAIVLQRLPSAKNRTLRDTLVLVLADCLYYSTPVTLAALAAQNQTHNVLSGWFTMIFANRPSGKPKHFRRLYDKKVCVLGLLSLLLCPEEALTPPALKEAMPQVLAGIARLLLAHKEQQEEMDKLAAEDDDDEDEDEEGGEDEEDDDEEGGDDDDDPEGDEYLKRLTRRAKQLLGEGDDDDDDDTDDEFTDEEEQQTPLDKIDPYVVLADALTGAAAPRLQPLVAAMDAAGQAALQGLVQHARERQLKELQPKQ